MTREELPSRVHDALAQTQSLLAEMARAAPPGRYRRVEFEPGGGLRRELSRLREVLEKAVENWVPPQQELRPLEDYERAMMLRYLLEDLPCACGRVDEGTCCISNCMRRLGYSGRGKTEGERAAE